MFCDTNGKRITLSLLWKLNKNMSISRNEYYEYYVILNSVVVYVQGFIELLGQLTSTGDISYNEFIGKSCVSFKHEDVAIIESLDCMLVLYTFNYSFCNSTDRFESMQKCPNTYYVTVVEDTSLGRVVGSASLVLEQKFIHKCALVSCNNTSTLRYRVSEKKYLFSICCWINTEGVINVSIL